MDVLQPCVSFNNTYEKYNSLVEILDHVPGSYQEAMSIAKRSDKLPIGIIYQQKRPVFHRALYGDRNPAAQRMSREERIEKVKGLLAP